jgi:hypothetical protein
MMPEGPEMGTVCKTMSAKTLKPRHAAALVLVGWYMITPPISYDTKATPWINFKAPLTEWTIIEKYQSKEDCVHALSGRDHLAEQAGKRGDVETKESWRQAFSKARCSAENDLLPNGGFIGKIR